MLETYWLGGYKIAARSKSQALAAYEQLMRRDAEVRRCTCGCDSGSRPDYRVSNSGYAACHPNNLIPC